MHRHLRPAAFTAALVASVLAAGALAPLTAHAQPAEATPDAATAVPDALRSPRATMRTFLEAVVAASSGERARILDAVRCLDLSSIPAGVRADVGDDLAVKLKEVIDRVRFVDYNTIPESPDGPPWVFETIPALDASIVIAKVPDGRWLFSSATIDRVPELFSHFESAARVEGVMGDGLSLSPSLWLRSKMPPELRARWILMEHWQWLALIALILIGWTVGRIVRALLSGPIQRQLERRAFAVPSELVSRMLAPMNQVAMGLVWMAGIRWVGLDPGVAAVAIVIFKFLAALGVIRVAMRAINLVTWRLQERAKLTPSKFDDLAVPFFNKTAKVVVFAIGILFMADVFGISPASLLAGLGLGGLAIALAAQDTVKNLFGSFTVILDRPFEVGDGIRIPGAVEGTVEEVGFRSTRVRTWDNTLVTVPNGNLISANVENLGNRTFFRYRATLGLAYDTPPEKVEAFCRGFEELVRLHPETRKEAYFCRFAELGAHSLDLIANCHFAVPDGTAFLTAKHALLLDVLNLADRLGVAFAFPTQTLHLLNGGAAPTAPGRALTPAETYRLAGADGIAAATAISEASRAPVPDAEVAAPDA